MPQPIAAAFLFVAFSAYVRYVHGGSFQIYTRMHGGLSVFEPNIHSVWQIEWRNVAPEVSAEIADLVRQRYGAIVVASVEQVDEWEQASNNYRVACDIAGDAGYILVRRHIVSRPEEIHAAVEVMAHLRQSGVSVPNTITSVDGQSVILINGTHWQAFEYIAGNHFRGDAEQLIQAATATAEMHRALLLFPRKEIVGHVDAVVGHLRVDYWDAIPEFSGTNPFELLLKNKQAFVQEKTRETIEALAAVQEQDEVIHGDIHPQNFLFQDNALAAIIDFGNMARADQMNDVAMAYHRLVRQYIVHARRPWEDVLAEGVRLFLDAYTAVHPLEDVQMRLLPAFADALLLRKMAYNLDLYRTGRRRWEEALSQWERFLSFMDEIDAIRAAMP